MINCRSLLPSSQFAPYGIEIVEPPDDAPCIEANLVGATINLIFDEQIVRAVSETKPKVGMIFLETADSGF